MIIKAKASKFVLKDTSRPMTTTHDPPINERLAELGCKSGRLDFTKLEDALDDRKFSAGGVETTERCPVIDNHATTDHITASVHCAGLHPQP